ncbi:MAG: hypothetical protein H6835_18675 [Planctomycetes bacterium]|nr:hypothetical protein [Planctomycetota bacterium]
MRHTLLAALFALAPVAAQDMIGVTWTGSVVAFDSFTGVGQTIGWAGGNMNALARDADGTLWTAIRPVGTWELATIDPTTGSATSVGPTADLRGMAWHEGQMFAIREGGDDLVTIDLATGADTLVGTVGFSAVQSLCSLGGQLYAWDVFAGLLLVDAVTGAGTDVDPAVGTNGADVQWLARRADGQLVGGSSQLFAIAPATGLPTLIGGAGLGGMRGAEPLQDYVRNFGSGCDGLGGLVTSSAVISGGIGAPLNLQSTNHEASAIGLVLFGLSNTQYGALPLPVSVDAVFGTSGCTLYVSPDVMMVTLTSATFPATLDLQVPILDGWPGAALFAQHAVLENVPGGLSLSDAVVVQFGF